MDLWEGMYDHWEDAPEIAGAFDSTHWLDNSLIQATESLHKILPGQAEISENASSRDYILPSVCAMAKRQGEILKVLDFGGGLGSSFCSVLGSINSSSEVEFHVVEGSGVCNTAKEIFPRSLNIHFHDEIPQTSSRFDIIHAGSSLQYIDDWRDLLATFAHLKPRFLILADVLAGDIKPFVTIQNYYQHKIRIRFLNLKELIGTAEELGFELLYKSLYISPIFGKEGSLPMDKFPQERRLKHPCQLLFKLNTQ